LDSPVAPAPAAGISYAGCPALSHLFGPMSESEAADMDLDTRSRETSDPAVMAKEPLVSVWMTTYNHEPYVGRAVEGVLMQVTDFTMELVIGEDCSTDRTCEIVMEYQKRHPNVVRVITSNRNVGLFENDRRVNKALRGKYVAFCEGDDYWIHPRKLQMQVDIMEADPGVGLVHGGYHKFLAPRNRLVKWQQWRPRAVAPAKYDDLFTQLLAGQYQRPTTPHTSNVCMRRDLYLAVRENNPDSFREEFIVVDTQTWLEAARLTRFAFIDEPLAVYNYQPDSISNTQDMDRRIDFFQTMTRMQLHMCRKYGCPRDVEDGISLRHSGWLLFLSFMAGRRELALECAGTISSIRGGLTLLQRLLLAGTTNRGARAAVGLGYKAYGILPDALQSLFRRSL
jgi:glycosyltransferase involved in cell wall biosynthesis